MSFTANRMRQGAAGAGGDYEIDSSLRFNDDDSAYLSWTPSSAGNRKKWTFSCWVKRGNITQHAVIFSADTDRTVIRFSSNDGFKFAEFGYGGAENTWAIEDTTRLFRDPSAWYHIVAFVDSAQATAAERAKLYINGVQVIGGSYPDQNQVTSINNTVQHLVGQRMQYSSGALGQKFDGYLAEVNFIDGSALAPTDFGEFDATYGHWKAKKYAGSYGTNGFYLDFKTSGTLGNDASSNSNNWTPNNLTASDSMLDSPTNNFSVMNPLHIHTDGYPLFAEGNLQITTALSPAGRCVSTMGVTSGKYYAEMYHKSGVAGEWVSPRNSIGITTDAGFTIRGADGSGGGNLGDLASGFDVGYSGQTGQKNKANSWTSYGATWAAGDIIGVALDMDNNQVTFYKNGASQGAISLTVGGAAHFAAADTSAGGGIVAVWNFGQDATFAGNKSPSTTYSDGKYGSFFYQPPAGFKSLCTQNLPDPAVVPGENFNALTYTGNGGTQSITGAGFQPDLVWTHGRSNATNHRLHDSVRGPTAYLESDSTGQEVTQSNTLTSFNADGFSLGSAGASNYSSWTFISWNWKAGGTDVSNTNGSITSSVSANTDAGFSIVSWSNSSAAAITVGHGLSKSPEIIFVKNRDKNSQFACYNKDVGATQYLSISDSDAPATYSGYWNNTDPTSTVFSVGNDEDVCGGSSAPRVIAYCFHSVDGFSKIGSYTGNGNADGVFVYTGFQPKYVLFRKTNAANEWMIMDDARDDDNPARNYLKANASDVEGAFDIVDFTSNGFKIRTTDGSWNTSGSNYIYMAFAEYPFKFSNAR